MESGKEFEQRSDLSALRDAVDKLRAQVEQMIVGQRDLIDFLIAAVLVSGHVLIEGVPGVAKTLSARLLARTLKVGFHRIQFTPDLMPSDILGTSIFNPKSAEFEFRAGPIFSNVILIDEVNRAPAKTQSALFEVMEERQATIDGTTYPMEDPFLVLATQNPIEHEGTYRLPEAQLDRFIFKLLVDYPSQEDEVQILARHHAGAIQQDLSSIKPVLGAKEVAKFRKQVTGLHVEEKLLQYIAALVGATRNHQLLTLGASPRASLALMRGAQAIAGMQGRDFVTPEDVQRVTAPVLRHRISLTPEQEMEGQTADEVIKLLIAQVEVPR